MTAKFVFQANSSLLKSRHVLLINEYHNPGYLTDISHSTCVHLNTSSFPYNSSKICCSRGFLCFSSCHFTIQCTRMLRLMCGFLCLTLIYLAHHKTLLIQVPKYMVNQSTSSHPYCHHLFQATAITIS